MLGKVRCAAAASIANAATFAIRYTYDLFKLIVVGRITGMGRPSGRVDFGRCALCIVC